MEKVFLTVTEAAQILGLGRSMAYRLVKEGRLPSVQLGTRRATRIPAAGLSRWVEKRISESERVAGQANRRGSLRGR